MNPTLLYFTKVSGALMFFYLCYKLFLSKDTNFVRNRFYFIGSMFIAVVVPFIKVTVRTIEVQPVLNPTSHLQTNAIVENIVEKSSIWPNILTVLLIIYCLGVLFFIVRLVSAYMHVIKIIVKSERSRFYELILALTQQAVAPFSMFKWLVIPKNTANHPDFENIVQHESIHSRQYHSVDLLLAEIMVAFQWFNPFVWMMKSAIIENHEYIVDKTLIKTGVDARKYQYSLLSYATSGSGQLAVANHFNVNLLKKRISMMNRNKSSQWYGLKNLIIFLSVSMVVTFSATFETKVIAQSTGNKPMIIINGKKSDMGTMQKIDPENIQSVSVNKNGKNNVIEVTTKDTLISQSSVKTNGIKVYRSGDKEKSVVVVYGQKRDTTVMTENMEGVKVVGFGKQSHIMIDTVKTDVVKDVVKVVGYAVKNEPRIVIRGHSNMPEGFSQNNQKALPDGVLCIIDGKVVSEDEFSSIDPETYESIEVLKDQSAIALYGDKAKNGVIIIKLKDQKVANKEYKLLFAPNPSSDDVTVTLDGSTSSNKLDVKMYDKFGKVVFNDKKSGPVFTVSVGSLPADVYIMVATDGDKVYKGNLSVVH